MTQVDSSQYFSRAELECRHTGECKMDANFMAKLDALREAYGKPITLSSAYRHPSHPVEARKRSTSPGAHTTGRAADILCSRSQAHRILTLAMTSEMFTGIGVQQKGSGGRFIHLDDLEGTINQPRPTVWSY